ncbi:thiamine diphosphokinase [Rhodobacteraceae bacterium]|nr:thiamine diphosphokinase [Paracoccaceae bacterium]
MNRLIVSENEPITLLGGAPIDASLLAEGLRLAPKAVAADGGAKALFDHGHCPLAVIGDLDSLAPDLQAQVPAERLHRIAEQDSTDFEKCLSRIEAPLIVGVGFLGGRADHQMAVQSVLVRYAYQRCLLIGTQDIICVVPPQFALDLPVGTRVSLFPMAPTKVASQGLDWPTDGLEFSPSGQIGTSNRCNGKLVLAPENCSMLLILPRKFAEPVASALQCAPKWPAPL